MSWMTEDEASGKWCPMARALVRSDGTPEICFPVHNRYIVDTDDGDEIVSDLSVNCIGSKCMMWVMAPDDLQFEIKDHGKLLGGCGLVRR